MASLVYRRLFLPAQWRSGPYRTLVVGASLGNKTNAKADPVKQLFLDKLQEYKLKKKSGKIPDMTPQTEQEYREQLERLRNVYGGPEEDMTKFPTFEFDKK